MSKNNLVSPVIFGHQRLVRSLVVPLQVLICAVAGRVDYEGLCSGGTVAARIGDSALTHAWTEPPRGTRERRAGSRTRCSCGTQQSFLARVASICIYG